MEQPFDPNDESYYHTGCCDSHKASRYVAITSVASIVLRTTIIALAAKEKTLYYGIFTAADFLCIVILLCAVYKEIRYLLLPYLIFQIYGAGSIMYATGLQLSGEREISFSDGTQPTKGVRMAIFIMRIIWIVLIVYFFKIILNFYLFLQRREAAERKYGPQGIAPVIAYKPQYEAEYEAQHQPYRPQPPNSQYQEYPPQDHLARYQEYPPQDHLQRYQEYPPQDHLATQRYQEYPPQDHLASQRYQEYPPQDHLVKNEPPPPYPKPRHSYVSIEGDQTMMHPGQYHNQEMCQQHPGQYQNKPKYQASGAGMVIAAMGGFGGGGGF